MTPNTPKLGAPRLETIFGDVSRQDASNELSHLKFGYVAIP